MNEYSFIAAIYDFLLTPFLREMRNEVVMISKSLSPRNVADLCCGTGNQLKLLKKSGLQNLTCVDLSAEMLRIAAKGGNAPECRLTDAADTGYSDGSFDPAIISLALHEKSPEKGAAVLLRAVLQFRYGRK